MACRTIVSGYRRCLGGLISALLICAGYGAGSVYALPQFAFMEHASCATCHVSAQGGGIRNFRGWQYLRGDALVDPGKDGAGFLSRLVPSSNTVLDNRLTLGTDIRFQSAKSHISSGADRDQFTMQTALYAAYELHPVIDIEGSYNLAESAFPGQEEWTASVILHPEYSFTQVRLGYFHPSIGIRYDDHTMLVRQVPGFPGRSLIPPAYAELGAEANVFTFEPLILTAGIYSARNFAGNMAIGPDGASISLIDDDSQPSFAARIEYRGIPHDTMPYLSGGTSILWNGDFMLTSVFAGAGIGDRAAILAEYAWSAKEDIRTTDAVSAELSVRLSGWLLPYLRGEYGVTSYDYQSSGTDPRSISALIGAQVFVLPCLAIRPEYRFFETRDHRSTRYALQAHLFY